MEVIYIKDIEELKKRKIKPDDLNKKFIDRSGQEYKLKFDPVSQKVKIVKIVKAVLDGTFVKKHYNEIAKDKEVKEAFKKTLVDKGKDIIGDSEKEKESEENNNENYDEKRVSNEFISSDGIEIKDILSIEEVFKKIKERKDVMLNLLSKSKVLDIKFNYDDELLMREIERLWENDILNELDLMMEKYRDITNGIYDSQVKLKLYNEEIKSKLEEVSAEERLKKLREYYAADYFINSLQHIIKIFNDIEYKLENLPAGKLDIRTHIERQMFKDSLFTIKTCRDDIKKIEKFMNVYKKYIF